MRSRAAPPHTGIYRVPPPPRAVSLFLACELFVNGIVLLFRACKLVAVGFGLLFCVHGLLAVLGFAY